MSKKEAEMDELIIRAIGQTVEHEGKTILIAEDLLVDCMVLFVDMDTWRTIKDSVILREER